MLAVVRESRTVLVIIACGAVAAGLIAGSDGSPKVALMLVLLTALRASMIWFQIPKRQYLIGILFLAAPFDISKAVIAPLDRFSSPGLYMTVGAAAMLL